MLGDVTFIVEILEESASSKPGSTTDFENPLDLLKPDETPNPQSEMPTERMIVDSLPNQTLAETLFEEPIND